MRLDRAITKQDGRMVESHNELTNGSICPTSNAGSNENCDFAGDTKGTDAGRGSRVTVETAADCIRAILCVRGTGGIGGGTRVFVKVKAYKRRGEKECTCTAHQQQ